MAGLVEARRSPVSGNGSARENERSYEARQAGERRTRLSEGEAEECTTEPVTSVQAPSHLLGCIVRITAGL